jgi:hypothetical protein
MCASVNSDHPGENLQQNVSMRRMSSTVITPSSASAACAAYQKAQSESALNCEPFAYASWRSDLSAAEHAVGEHLVSSVLGAEMHHPGGAE